MCPPFNHLSYPRAGKYCRGVDGWSSQSSCSKGSLRVWKVSQGQWKRPGHQWHFQGTLKALFLASLGVQVVLISAYICHEKIELSLDIAFDEICKLIKWGWVWYREEFFRSRRPVGLRRITTFLVLHTLYIIGNFNSVIRVLNSKYFLLPNITTLSQTFFKAAFACFLGTVSDQKSAGDIRQAMFSFIFSQ